MRFEKLPIECLELDKKNPRVAQIMTRFPNPTSEQISLALGVGQTSATNGTSYVSLRESIKTNRGVFNPIIVNKKSDGNYVVIEGNTRLAIYREFLSQTQNAEQWKTIPCLVYDNMTEQEIDAIRLQAHLVGPRDWEPYAKAKYLTYLRDCAHLTWAQVVDYCGGRATEAQNYVYAYKDMEEYYAPLLQDESQFDQTRFSGFVELQKSKIKDVIVGTGFSLSDFARWIIDDKFDRMEHVRQLPRILTNEKSRAVFLENGSNAAMRIIDVPPTPSTDAMTLYQLASNLTERLRKINYEEIRRLQADPDSSNVTTMQGLSDELNEFIKIINPAN